MNIVVEEGDVLQMVIPPARFAVRLKKRLVTLGQKPWSGAAARLVQNCLEIRRMVEVEAINKSQKIFVPRSNIFYAISDLFL